MSPEASVSKSLTAAQLARNKLGAAARRRDPEAIAEARAALDESKIRAAVAAWPPLTAEQRAELAILLLTPAGGDHAAT
jgi:hypothetical protein